MKSKHLWTLSLALALGSSITLWSGRAQGAGDVGGASAITSRVSASITSGAAPLAVRFDATGTTSSDPTITSLDNGGTFRQISHSFNFGDPGAGNWALTGQPKNTQCCAPIATHVFELPGTYTVNVTQSHARTTDQAAPPITITVSDPDATYKGAKTVCINGTGTSDGLCPANGSYAASLPSVASNKRYLFKRGGSFPGFSVGGGSLSNIRVGAYGSGAKPVIATYVTLGGSTSNSDIVIQDLDIRGGLVNDVGHHLLALRVDVTAPTFSTNFYSKENASYLDMAYQYYVDCRADDPRKAANGLFYGVYSKAAILGLDAGTSGQHIIRLVNAYGVQISHGRMRYPLAGKHVIKMHAANTGASPTVWDGVSSATNLATSFNVVSNNIIGAADSSIDWAVAVDPQNNTGTQVEGVTDVIIENNQFYRNRSGGPKDITRGGRRITSRSNTSVNGSLIVDEHENRMNVPSGWDGPYFNK